MIAGREEPSDRKRAQAAQVAACRAAAPKVLAPLWVTIEHGPDLVLPDVIAALAEAFPEPDPRLGAVLRWFGHGDGTCPICWMLTARLAFTVPDLVASLQRAAEGEDAQARTGAAAFVATALEPRHALPAGVSRERLESLRAEVRALPATTHAALREGWSASGRPTALLEARLVE